MKALALVVALGLVLAAGASGSRQTPRQSSAQTALEPSCPHSSIGADGNMGPLFCVVVNPAAVRYFARLGVHTFALGRGARAAQVVAALIADYRHGGTEPILCSIYRLAAWRNQWSFGAVAISAVAATLKFPGGWCQVPRFTGIGS